MKEPVGKARIIDEGLDTDTMRRYVVFEFDPPWGDERTKTVYHTAITDDGLPLPSTDEMNLAFYRRYTKWIGYELVE